MIIPHIRAEREIELMLSILNAWKEHPPVPWHITEAGWRVYTKHPNRKVRLAAQNNPRCPKKLKYRIRTMKPTQK
jgi:hypothetical protein